MGERWFKLEGFRCPITSCSGGDVNTNWVCATHHSSMYISQTGNLRCEEHMLLFRTIYTHKDKIVQWRFDCGNHGDHPVHRFQKPDLQGFSFALSQAVQMMTTAGAEWVAALILELGTQFNKK